MTYRDLRTIATPGVVVVHREAETRLMALQRHAIEDVSSVHARVCAICEQRPAALLEDGQRTFT